VSTAHQSSSANYDPHSANPVYHLIQGFRFFFSGLPLLFKHPSLLGLSLLPIALTLIILALIVFGCVWLFDLVIGRGVSSVVSDLRFLAQAMIVVLALLVSYLIYLPLARVVLAPFSEALSRRTLAITRGTAVPKSPFGWGRAMWEGAKLVAFQLVVTVIVLVIGLSFPPVAPVGVVVAVFFSGLDYLDVPLSVRGLSLGKKLMVMWQNKSLALGFGAAAYLLLLIPLINLLSLPVGVIGATLLANGLDNTDTEIRRG